ncbi:class I SAM-dependent methyltransferase [Kitasatospora indigofera]|uniref:class I SAM-dependent methyltransferase n=1 Tax=Kitasatospora indigofera TaxID=67307 RepID=UPI00365E7BE4
MTARRPASSDRVPSDRVPADAAPNATAPVDPAPVDPAPRESAGASAGASAPVVAADLAAVPETALWTLYHRAVEAARPDTVLPDPKAVELVERIDYPFAERFGGGGGLQSQLQALRVACFDREVADFLTRHPRGTVVCLGEGLETQFWRVDNGRADWLSVDLPELISLRERLLPAGPRQRLLACSVTDPRWADEVDPAQGVLITAQGLLMYLRPGEVRDLIAGCAERFPGGTLVMDAVPRWFSALAVQGKLRDHGYQAPPMPFGMDAAERQKLRTAHPAVAEVRDVYPSGGRGLLGALLPAGAWLPVVSAKRPSVVALRFADRRP